MTSGTVTPSLTRSEIYMEALPLFNAGRIRFWIIGSRHLATGRPGPEGVTVGPSQSWIILRGPPMTAQTVHAARLSSAPRNPKNRCSCSPASRRTETRFGFELVLQQKDTMTTNANAALFVVLDQ